MGLTQWTDHDSQNCICAHDAPTNKIAVASPGIALVCNVCCTVKIRNVQESSQPANWTELNWTATSWPSYTTQYWSRALASQSWLAAVRELEVSSVQFGGCEHAFILEGHLMTQVAWDTTLTGFLGAEIGDSLEPQFGFIAAHLLKTRVCPRHFSMQ